jgi:hypothetical protein
MSSILENEEVLDELMTSDFHEDLKPDQWRSYIMNFRKYYKLMYSKYKRLSEDVEVKDREQSMEVNMLIRTIDEMRLKVHDLEHDNLTLGQKRRLTFKERFTGWINNDI